MATRWYVIQVYSGFENKVAVSIRDQARQNNMENLIEAVEVPTEEVVRMRRGSKVSAERKFFPGYVLVYMNKHGCYIHIVIMRRLRNLVPQPL